MERERLNSEDPDMDEARLEIEELSFEEWCEAVVRFESFWCREFVSEELKEPFGSLDRVNE